MLARQGFNRPVIGDGPTLSTKVIELAGPAAVGLIGHTGFSSEVPAPNIARFVADYQRRYGAKPDHNAAKGYFAVQVLRVSLRAVGRADREAFLKHIRDTRLDGHADPKLLTSSVTYDMFGDLNHGSYVMQVRGGRPRLIASLSAIDRQFVELPGGRSLALNSDELRREVQTLLRAKEGTQEAANRATQR